MRKVQLSLPASKRPDLGSGIVGLDGSADGFDGQEADFELGGCGGHVAVVGVDLGV